jgi:hypothetical protein
MTLLDAGDRVALPDQAGGAFLGTVVEEDTTRDEPSVLVSWDDQPELTQSVPEASLLQVSPVPTAPTLVVAPGVKEYKPRLTGWRKHAHWISLASGVGAVAVGTWGMIVLHSWMH